MSGRMRRSTPHQLDESKRVVGRVELAAELGQHQRGYAVGRGKVPEIALVGRGRAADQRRAEGGVVQGFGQQNGVDGRTADVEPGNDAHHAHGDGGEAWRHAARVYESHSAAPCGSSPHTILTRTVKVAYGPVQVRPDTAPPRLGVAARPLRLGGGAPIVVPFALLVAGALVGLPFTLDAPVAWQRLIGLLVAGAIALLTLPWLRRPGNAEARLRDRDRRLGRRRAVGNRGGRPGRLPGRARVAAAGRVRAALLARQPDRAGRGDQHLVHRRLQRAGRPLPGGVVRQPRLAGQPAASGGGHRLPGGVPVQPGAVARHGRARRTRRAGRRAAGWQPWLRGGGAGCCCC